MECINKDREGLARAEGAHQQQPHAGRKSEKQQQGVE